MNNSEYIVKFVTSLPQEYEISNNEIAVQGDMNQSDLSSLIQQLLSAENPDQEYNQLFDFFINGISLRSTLHEFITSNEIATEKTLQIEYLFAVPEPKLKQTINMNDWIIAISRLNNHILTCLSNGDIVVCTEKGKILKTYKTKMAKSFTIFENIVISTHWDCTVRVQRLTDNLELIAQGSLPSYGECSCINKKNTNEFCVGTANGELIFFDLSTVQKQGIEMVQNFKVHQQQITCCQWIRNSTILTGSYDHSICLFNKRTESINKQLFAKDSAIIGLCYLENNQQIVSVHEDGYIKLWDSLSEQLIKIYKSSLSQLTCIAVNANGQIIVSSMDGNTYLWDLRGEVPLYQLNGEGKAMACIDGYQHIQIYMDRQQNTIWRIDQQIICAEVPKSKLSKEEYEKFKRAERRKNNKSKKKCTNEKQEIIEEVVKADEEQVVYDEETFQEIEIDALITGKHYDNFKQVFDNFNQHAERLMMKTYEKVYEAEKEKEKEQEEQQAAEQQQQQQQQQIQQLINEPNQTIQNYLQQGKKKEAKLSKKQRKQLRWLKYIQNQYFNTNYIYIRTVAELKQKVKRPDLVEFWDITSPDPMFLIQLKSVRNSVTVPRHWSQKRKYLQNKRGILKEPFQLPDYIEKTGIAKLRDPFVDRDGGKMVRQKLRERMNPKQGKLDIDYQILHDAFFKYQTKPQMTKHGEIYFEGKEEEMRAKNFCPGKMSAELRSALGCTDFQAPPWLPNMQRYGPPPSYPHMRFIGMASIFAEPSSYHTSVKQVIEDSCKKADQPGLYATFKYYDEEDLNELSQKTGLQADAPVDKSLWGKIEEVEDEAEVEQEEEEEPEAQQRQEQQFDNSSYQFGDSETRLPGRSISGLQTPDVDLRRNLQNDPRPLYQQLEQVQIDPSSGNQIFMTGHTYVLPKQ